jgi:hypothetical protein
MMAERTVKHLGFWYMVEIEDRFHPGRTYWVERTARQGETIDIPREEDVTRGDEIHAFVTEEDLKKQEAEAKAEQSPILSDGTDTGTEEVDSVSVMSDDELVTWIKEDKPTAHEVVDAAEGDPNLARRLLDAEDAATDGDSRKSVISGLTAIISQG